EANRQAAEAASKAAGETATAAGAAAKAAGWSGDSMGPALVGGTVHMAIIQSALLNQPIQFKQNLGQLLLLGTGVATGDLPLPQPPTGAPPAAGWDLVLG